MRLSIVGTASSALSLHGARDPQQFLAIVAVFPDQFPGLLGRQIRLLREKPHQRIVAALCGQCLRFFGHRDFPFIWLTVRLEAEHATQAKVPLISEADRSRTVVTWRHYRRGEGPVVSAEHARHGEIDLRARRVIFLAGPVGLVLLVLPSFAGA